MIRRPWRWVDRRYEHDPTVYGERPAWAVAHPAAPWVSRWNWGRPGRGRRRPPNGPGWVVFRWWGNQL